MTTDQQTQTDDRIDTSDADGTYPAAGAANGASTVPVTDADHAYVTALLAEERTVPFIGLTDAGSGPGSGFRARFTGTAVWRQRVPHVAGASRRWHLQMLTYSLLKFGAAHSAL